MQTKFNPEDDACIDAVAARVIQKLDEREKERSAKTVAAFKAISEGFATTVVGQRKG
jgi:hypothetical protein